MSLKIEVSKEELVESLVKLVSKKYKLRPRKFLENKISFHTDVSPDPFSTLIIETNGSDSSE